MCRAEEGMTIIIADKHMLLLSDQLKEAELEQIV